MEWPEGFMWGTGASSTQCEGAAPASDWYEWERAGHAPISGEGNGFAQCFGDDFAIFAQLGLSHHRLSIEWARVEPAEGHHDPAAIEHYRAILSAAHSAGVSPWVCLHHFTLPRWFAGQGGFLVEENWRTAWTRHVDFVADTFGDLVAGWQPVNETNYYAGAAYRRRGWPPGHDSREEFAAVTEAIHLATAEAAVRLGRTGAPVSSIYGLYCEVPLDDEPATLERAAALRAVNWDPWVGLVRDGVLRVPDREDVHRPDLAGCFDMIGFSYYGTAGVAAGAPVGYPIDAPRSPLGYHLWPQGVDLVIERLYEELGDTPLLVAEFGVGTSDDAVRQRYLSDGLAAVHGALERGRDIRGFFHWTGVDNYEWLHGYDVAFGLLDRDRNVRPSAQILAREARR